MYDRINTSNVIVIYIVIFTTILKLYLFISSLANTSWALSNSDIQKWLNTYPKETKFIGLINAVSFSIDFLENITRG